MSKVLRTRGDISEATGKDISKLETQSRRARASIKIMTPKISHKQPSRRGSEFLTVVDSSTPELFVTLGGRQFKVALEEVK